MKQAVALRDWIPMYSDPIDVRAGESVIVGDADPEWPGWVWCVDPRGKGGWTPEEIVERSPETRTGIVSQDFTARELKIRAGEIVSLLRLQSGWYWARGGNGEEGWIPATHVKPA
jgi:uncharacterized protein YgiM (DUF1202 family)